MEAATLLAGRSVASAPAINSRRQVRIPSLQFWMVLAIFAVTVVAYWDEQREFSAALADFAGEQTALAQAVATTLRTQLVDTRRTQPNPPATDAEKRLQIAAQAERFLATVRGSERPQLVRLLVQLPFGVGLASSAGPVVRSTAIESGLASGLASVRLSRAEAAGLGLPARTALAGLARLDAGDSGRWGIAVVASARRERDRERFAQWRLALSVVVASGLVFAFGGLALRNQRKQLLLSQELALAALQSERDDRLVRADKLATMGAFATGIAHEVSTPLAVIVGRAEQLLSKLQDDERSKRAVEAIAEQAERITGIVRGFLALARGDTPHLQHVDPQRLGSVAVGLVEHRFAKAGVHLYAEFAQDIPHIACEPRLIEQVLVNLLLNACDACEPGGRVELRIGAEGERVAFVVTDDGAGISVDAAARILDPFFTTKPVGEGSGLGLAIANELVKHHRGSLTVVARESSRGTRACVEIPAAAEPSDA